MTGKLHRRDKPEDPVGIERDTEPVPEQDMGTECPVCGRRGRAEGHH